MMAEFYRPSHIVSEMEQQVFIFLTNTIDRILIFLQTEFENINVCKFSSLKLDFDIL